MRQSSTSSSNVLGQNHTSLSVTVGLMATLLAQARGASAVDTNPSLEVPAAISMAADRPALRALEAAPQDPVTQERRKTSADLDFLAVPRAFQTVERLMETEPTQNAFNRFDRKVKAERDVMSSFDDRRMMRPYAAQVDGTASRELERQKEQSGRAMEQLQRDLVRSRVVDLSIRKGSWLTDVEASRVAFGVEVDMRRAFGGVSSGTVKTVVDGAVGAGGTLAKGNPYVMVGGIAVKVVTGSALAEGDADRARMQQILLNEGQRAADGNVRSFNNRALQRMAAENPTAYDALASRRGDLLPARAELEKARAAASGDDTPSAIRRGAVKGAELKGEEKEQIKKEAQQLGTLGKQTEGALDEAVRAEGKLDKAEEALERKQREIAQAGADPASLEETPEFKQWCEAEQQHRLAMEEFNACCDHTANLLSRLDPQAGAIFSRSMSLIQGVQKGLSAGLSKIKLSDFLSITSLSFALLDAFMTSGPDPVQQSLENIQKMLEGMDKKLDRIEDKISKMHREMLEEFSRLGDNVEGGRFEARIYHRRVLEAISEGFDEIISLQIASLEELRGIKAEVGDISVRIDEGLGLLQRIRFEVEHTSDLVKVSGIDNSMHNLRDALMNQGAHPTGTAGLVHDFENLSGNLISVAKKLGDTPMLHDQDPEKRRQAERELAELRLSDLRAVPLADHPRALARALGFSTDEDDGVFGRLYQYRFVDEALSILLRVSSHSAFDKLPAEDRARLRLSDEQLAAYDTYLTEAQSALHALGLFTAEKAAGILRADLQVFLSAIDQTVSAKEGLGNATPQRLYDPRNPLPSLQEVADGEKIGSIGAEIPDLEGGMRAMAAGSVPFAVTVQGEHWTQEELRNEEGVIRSFRNDYDRSRMGGGGRGYNYWGAAEVGKALPRMASPALYMNMETHEVSTTPKKGFLPFATWGSWDDTTRSGAYRPAELSWKAAPATAIPIRTEKTAFDVGAFFPQAEVGKQQLIGNRIGVSFDPPQLELVDTVARGAEFDPATGIETPRPFTKENPGRAGEKIIVKSTQRHELFVLPMFHGSVSLGNVPVGVIDMRFEGKDPDTSVMVKSVQRFVYPLDFNGVPRSGGLFLHTEPAPLCQLKLQAMETTGGGIERCISRGKQTEKIDLTRFQAAQASMLRAMSPGLAAVLGAKDGAWRDGVTRIELAERVVDPAAGTAGIFKRDNVWVARFAVTHATQGTVLLDAALDKSFEPGGLNPVAVVTMNHALSTLRTGASAPEALRPLQTAVGNWVSTKANSRAELVVKQLDVRGSLLQQEKQESVASALLFRNLVNDFGYDIFQSDFSRLMEEGGTIKNTLINQWRDPNESLLDLAARMAVLKTGKATKEQIVSIATAALAQIDDVQARLDAALKSGARWADPHLDRTLDSVRKVRGERKSRR